MSTQPEALRLAEFYEGVAEAPPKSPDNSNIRAAAAELRRLHHNNQVLTDALWKACGDNEEAVNSTIASQGELK